ncbi:MAG: LacI family DNA-binding transcriptional regulator [Microbacteriaceae bacterium]
MPVSVKQVAAHAGVSVGTVSNVLNNPGRVTPATVNRVQASIESLGFVRNDAARQLRAGNSQTIGLIVLDVSNPFFTDLARGAEEAAEAAGYAVLLANSDEESERELRYLKLFEQQRVQGVLISPASELSHRLQKLRQHGVAIVLVDRESTDKSFSSVSVDDIAGGKLATDHLISQGRTRIVFVGGPIRLQQVVDRFQGATEAVKDKPAVSLEFIATDSLNASEGRRAAKRILQQQPRPDAVFAANDVLALGVMQGLIGEGNLRIPDDIALIGYDDISFAEAAVVPLSSIRQPSEQIGSRAVEILLNESENPRAESQHIRFQPELVVRASTLQLPPSDSSD